MKIVLTMIIGAVVVSIVDVVILDLYDIMMSMRTEFIIHDLLMMSFGCAIVISFLKKKDKK